MIRLQVFLRLRSQWAAVRFGSRQDDADFGDRNHRQEADEEQVQKKKTPKVPVKVRIST